MPIDHVSRIVKLQIKAMEAKITAEIALKAASRALEQMAMRDTPGAMLEGGVERFDADGWTVILAPLVQGHVDKGNPEPAFRRIKADGEGDLIRYTLTIDFPRTSAGKADAIKAQKAVEKATGQDTQLTLGIHSASLGAYLRRHWLDEGFPLMTLFRGSVGLRANIKPTK